ncbi:hypothetical protein ACOME3_000623 [Neoechinorhynchus agilis]
MDIVDVAPDTTSKTDDPFDEQRLNSPTFKANKVKLISSFRFLITILLSVGIMITYGQRNGLSSIIVCMVKDDLGNGYYSWKGKNGLILGAFYIGYALLQFAGGYLVARTNAFKTMAFFSALSSLATLIGPFAANLSYKWLFLTRVIVGLGQAVIWPSLYGLAAVWFPKTEKATLLGLQGSSSSLGTVLSLYAGGQFCKVLNGPVFYITGWAIFFYILGLCGFVWLVFWYIYGSRSPTTSKKISAIERDFISELTDGSDRIEVPPVPWLQLLRSKEVWGLCFTMTFFDFGLYATYTVIPMYLREALRYSYDEMSIYSALPHVISMFGCTLNGYVSDLIINKHFMSRNNCRKLFQTASSFLMGLSMLTTAFIRRKNRVYAVLLLQLTGFFMSLTMAGGYFVSVSDISGPFSSIVFGLGNTMSAIAGFFSPTVASTIIGTDPDDIIARWKIVMMVYSCSMFLSGFVFALLGSGETCEWAKPTREKIDSEAV